MDLDAAALRTFAAVVDAGTFDAAARALHLTPSAVSQRIKALEHEVGRVLLTRTKPVRTTESGAVVLRLARQVRRAQDDAQAELRAELDAPTSLPLVVNADSLDTWVIPALASLPPQFGFELHRADEDHTTELLRSGAAMAAVTADPVPVQGCSVTPLGSLRYLALCSPAFAGRHGLPADGHARASARLLAAPMLDFDRQDDLQAKFFRARFDRPAPPPRHLIPSSTAFAQAIRAGLGWGLLPEPQLERFGAGLVPVLTGDDEPSAFDVPLYWQRWKLESAALGLVTEAVLAHARSVLRH